MLLHISYYVRTFSAVSHFASFMLMDRWFWYFDIFDADNIFLEHQRCERSHAFFDSTSIRFLIRFCILASFRDSSMMEANQAPRIKSDRGMKPCLTRGGKKKENWGTKQVRTVGNRRKKPGKMRWTDSVQLSVYDNRTSIILPFVFCTPHYFQTCFKSERPPECMHGNLRTTFICNVQSAKCKMQWAVLCHSSYRAFLEYIILLIRSRPLSPFIQKLYGKSNCFVSSWYEGLKIIYSDEHKMFRQFINPVD